MIAKLDNVVKLKDGRNLGYAEYGDPSGRPVLSFHGLPSCRLESKALILDLGEALASLNVRLIAPDRPGIGLSDWRPYTIADYPDEVVELADILGLDKFGVFGVSSGPKFVLACAWKIPERLTGAVAVSSTAPFDMPGVMDAYQRQLKILYTIAARAPWILRIMLARLGRGLRKNPDPEKLLDLFGDMPEVDQKAFSNPEVLKEFGPSTLEAFRQGARGATHDFYIEARPWGFDPADIKIPVHIFHGGLDVATPPELGRLLAQVIPQASYKEYPDQGHSLVVEHIEEFLSHAL